MFAGMDKAQIDEFLEYVQIYNHAATDEERAIAQARAMDLVADATNKAVTAVKSLSSALQSLPSTGEDLKGLVDQLNSLG